MSDAWEDRRKAAEESYFAKQEAEKLMRLKTQGVSGERKSPVSGEAMQPFDVHGVQAFRCPTSGGVWFEAGKLEELLRGISEEAGAGSSGWLGGLLNDLMRRD